MTTEAQSAAALPLPGWISLEDMPSMPSGWYWAAFPGSWEWYSREQNATRGIDHGDTRYHELMSRRYWGPWSPPAE